MSKAFDGFDDLIHENAGIYGRDTASLAHALADHDAREVSAAPEGVTIRFTHDLCGQQQVGVFEWADAIAIAHGLPPRIAYGTRINPSEASLIERYPSWAAELGDWTFKPPTGPWRAKLACAGSGCPNRPMTVAMTTGEAAEAIRTGRAQRWIKDEAPLMKWAQAAAQAHAKQKR
jgi:hypothetical protein